jgi:FkbH-like protein
VTKTIANLDDLLAVGKLADLRTAIFHSDLTPSLAQVQRLISHAESLGPSVDNLRLGIVHTYTSELLNPWLALAAALQGLNLQAYHAPYGLSLQEAEANSGLVRHEPDLTLLLMRREDLHPDLAKPLVGFSAARQKEIATETLERLCGIVGQFRKANVGQIVLTLLPPIFSPGLGIYDAQFDRSESIWWANLKAEIGRCLRESMRASLFFDLDEVLQQLGRRHFFDRRLWYSARYPFAAAAAAEIARQVIGMGALIKLPKVKVIVLDADNTLWGGVIGEDGIHGIALGPDYPGSAFLDFQRRLLDYQQRGFILALCSKNNPADIEEVLKEHPHQILRHEHFAARRVNWQAKPDNLLSLAEELSLGLDSFLVVDDSDHECEAIRRAFPEVEVIQTPARPIDVPTCLERVARLEVLSLTAEDLAKTELYARERQRNELKQNFKNNGVPLREYLASLEMKMRIGFNDSAYAARLSQLTQKTNQFNLTTRRYNEQQMQAFILDSSWLVAHFSLTDAFGDSGVVGLAIFHIPTPKQAELDTFLMSCRVIGRDVESAFLHALLRRLADYGVDEIVGCYQPTAKNELARNFLPDQGFEKCTEGRYRRDLRTTSLPPESAFPVAVEMAN